MMQQEFDFTREFILEDERALLRPLRPDDERHLLTFAMKEPELWTYSLVAAAGEDGMKSYIKSALQAKAEGREYPFIVYDKQLNQYAGSTRFYDIQKTQKSLQLGYTWYGRRFQGTGLNKHCKFLLLQFAFETAGIERVEFRADFANKKSIAAMQSIGCTIEGVLRSHILKPDGNRRDSIILSILKEEWFTSVKDNQKNKLVK